MTGLIGWWPLHETTGNTAHDLSGKGNHGTVNGATQGVAGKMGLTSYSFDGSNYVDMGSAIPQLNEYTITGWTYHEAPNNGNNQYSLILAANQTVRVFCNGSGSIVGSQRDSSGTYHDITQSVAENTWTHWTLTWNGTDLKFYTNKTQAGTKTVSDHYDSNNNDQISANGTGAAHLNGKIQDVRLYNRALTSQEIQTLYQQGSQDHHKKSLSDGTDNGAVSRWKFNNSNSDTSVAKDTWGDNNANINGPNYNNDSIRGKSLDVDGSGEYVEVTDNSSLRPSNFTISTWFNFNDLSSPQLLIDKLDEGSEGFRIIKYKDPHELAFHIMDSGTTKDVKTTKFTAGNWYNATMTYNNNQNNLAGYLNGKKIGEVSGNITHTNENMIIGGRLKDGTYDLSFNGKIDDLRIYNRALKPWEVHQLYQWGTKGKDLRKQLINAKGD